jgi:hypothetical protein
MRLTRRELIAGVSFMPAVVRAQTTAVAADWPEWRGRGRLGVWAHAERRPPPYDDDFRLGLNAAQTTRLAIAQLARRPRVA